MDRDESAKVKATVVALTGGTEYHVLPERGHALGGRSYGIRMLNGFALVAFGRDEAGHIRPQMRLDDARSIIDTVLWLIEMKTGKGVKNVIDDDAIEVIRAKLTALGFEQSHVPNTLGLWTAVTPTEEYYAADITVSRIAPLYETGSNLIVIQSNINGGESHCCQQVDGIMDVVLKTLDMFKQGE